MNVAIKVLCVFAFLSLLFTPIINAKHSQTTMYDNQTFEDDHQTTSWVLTHIPYFVASKQLWQLVA